MHQLAPFCIAIGCFIANLSTFKELYKKSLLQSLHTSTISYKKIIIPLFVNTFLWFLLALYSTSIVSPKVHLKINEKLLKKTVFNPLLAMQSGALFQDTPHFSLGRVVKDNKQIKDFCLLAEPFSSKAPIALSAENSVYEGSSLYFSNIHLTIPEAPLSNPQHMLKSVHSYNSLEIPVQEAIGAMAKRTNIHYMQCIPLSHLFRIISLKSFTEICYRLSLALFTLSISILLFIYFKNPTKMSTMILSSLGLFLALSFFGAKGLSKSFCAPILYLLLHSVIIISLIFSYKKRGYVENTL